jgi:hypothetical protein
MTVATGNVSTMPDSLQPTDLVNQLRALVEHAQAGDLSVVPEIQLMLNTHPELWAHAADLVERAQQVWIQVAAGPLLPIQDAMRVRLENLKAELRGDSTSPLEKLLVDRIAICWLQVHYLDVEHGASLGKPDNAIPSPDVVRKRLDSANKRYLFAIKQLALVRKLLRPPVSRRKPEASPAGESTGKSPIRKPHRSRREAMAVAG